MGERIYESTRIVGTEIEPNSKGVKVSFYVTYYFHHVTQFLQREEGFI
jgi:hypothetical protein